MNNLSINTERPKSILQDMREENKSPQQAIYDNYLEQVYDLKKNQKKKDKYICEVLKIPQYKLRMIKKRFNEIENKNLSSPSQEKKSENNEEQKTEEQQNVTQEEQKQEEQQNNVSSQQNSSQNEIITSENKEEQQVETNEHVIQDDEKQINIQFDQEQIDDLKNILNDNYNIPQQKQEEQISEIIEVKQQPVRQFEVHFDDDKTENNDEDINLNTYIPQQKKLKQKKQKRQKIQVQTSEDSFQQNLNVDDLKEKRSIVIIIKQYCMNFNQKLEGVIYNDQKKFMKSLYGLSLEKLQIILENIRSHLNIKRNADNFEKIMNTLILTSEKLAPRMGIYIDGLYEELIKDLEYQELCLLVSSELDISKYLNPKMQLLIHIAQKAYMKHSINKLSHQLNLDQSVATEIKDKYQEL